MSKPLHEDPELSLLQRAFVLSIEPTKLSIKLHVISIIIMALDVFAAYATVGTAVAPEYVPQWAFNVGKFFAWFVVACSIFFAIVQFFLFIFRLTVISTVAAKDSNQERIDAFRKTIEDWVRVYRFTSPFQFFSKWLARVALAFTFSGLVMKGYVFLPIAMGAGWVASVMNRYAVVRGIKQLFPELTPDSQGVIDVTNYTTNLR